MAKTIEAPAVLNSSIPDGVQHFLVWLLLFCVIALVVAIWIFAKWLTAGPWFKKKWNKLFNKNKETVEGVELVKGEVVVDNNYINELDERIKKAETPQELLELQLMKENHEKERIRLEEEIAQQEKDKLAKVQQKEDKARIKAEMKEKEKEFKAKEKERKEAQKASKKEGK